MPIKMVKVDNIRKWVDDRVQLFFMNIEQALNDAGLRAVKYAREDHSNNWQDQTGNLRSSIGYCIIKDGQVLNQSAFEPVQGKDGKVGTVGSETGKQFLQSVIAEYPEGYVLIVVAGMSYAAYVERKRDVLATAQLQCESDVESHIKDIINIWKQ